MNPSAQRAQLDAALAQLAPHDHFCSIYEYPEEHYAVAIPFMDIELKRGEKCIYIADDGTIDYVRQLMQVEGIDVEQATASKALTAAAKDQAYIERGSFKPRLMFNFCDDDSSFLRVVCVNQPHR